ncbi:MAG: sigma-70 family RNA polymerase sigma factor [Gammaproteobacteria bacterium]|nr:sigma-70 family RNA polymerase sigma factor [Gammaproteobacteria bacterium]
MRNSSGNNKELFERIMLPHLEAAFNLARWLVNNRSDAEDIVQEAYLKAFRLFDSYADKNSHAWILAIVRNTTYTWLKQNKRFQLNKTLDDESYLASEGPDSANNIAVMDPCEWQTLQSDIQGLYLAIDLLPLNMKEIIILREIEGCSYRELAEILDIPPGTVMSRVSRARQSLQCVLKRESIKEEAGEV